jgi:uncharacterized membrane protein
MTDYPPPPPPPPVPPPGSSDVQPADIGPAFSYAWQKFTQYAGPLVLITLVVFVGTAILNGINFLVNRDSFTFGRFILSIVLWAASALVGFALEYGVVRAGLAVVEGREPTFAEAWNMDRFGPFIVAAILRGLLVFVGLLLCVIPGIIVWFLTIFTPFFVIDRNLAPMDAIANSVALVRRHAGKLVLFCLVAWLVYVAGAIVCLVGLLVSIPVALVATAYMYKRIQDEPVAP